MSLSLNSQIVYIVLYVQLLPFFEILQDHVEKIQLIGGSRAPMADLNISETVSPIEGIEYCNIVRYSNKALRRFLEIIQDGIKYCKNILADIQIRRFAPGFSPFS